MISEVHQLYDLTDLYQHDREIQKSEKNQTASELFEECLLNAMRRYEFSGRK